MQFTDDRHATEEDLERYAMGRLAEPELTEFEEHLLVCDACQDRLAHEDSIRQSVRDTGEVLQRHPKTASGWTMPKLIWSFGLAAAVLIALISAWPALRQGATARSMSAATILLQTTRGPETPAATAPAGKPLTLVLDLTDLQAFSNYKLEVVDAGGRQVFQSEAVPQGSKMQAALARGLAAGPYFVRVYSPAHELLREYVLTIGG